MNSASRKSKATCGLALACLAGGMILATLAAGCRAPAPTNRRPSTEVDPCAERLHQVCGPLLLYYATNEKLPDNLATMKTTDPEPMPPLVCPVSGKPYIYNREGLAIPGKPGRLVLYDAAPSHSGMRWGILAEIVEGPQPLIARAVLVPESAAFSAKKP